MANRKHLVVSKAQLEIMNVVWDRGEATVAEVWDVLSQRRHVARNTVQTLMRRLEEKGWLRHRAVGNTFVYSAAVERAGTLQQIVSSLVDLAFAGSAEGLIMALLDGRGVTEQEARRIRSLVDSARKGKRR
jgi:BlaI family penicillinase repressor